ncbi:TPA: hypothetical protein DD394_04115 [bacterium UBP9_UBA11836]|nr:hypothetical protein [bacterium UBP9_UBA11836]
MCIFLISLNILKLVVVVVEAVNYVYILCDFLFYSIFFHFFCVEKLLKTALTFSTFPTFILLRLAV